MKTLFYILLLMTVTSPDLAGQTLTIEDMVKNIRQHKDYKSIRIFVEKHGFDYDTVMLPGTSGKMYSFLGDKEYNVIGLDQDTLAMRNAVFVRMEDDVTLRKLTVMTASNAYYQQLVLEMQKKKFTSREHPDKGKPMSYTSDLYKDVTISLSVVESVRDEKRYARFQVSVIY